MKKLTEEEHVALFMTMLTFKKTLGYGFCHVDRPSCFWPDVEVTHAEEINRWKNDLRKEKRGITEFEGSWGMGSNFENPMDIEILLNVFKPIKSA